MIFHVLGLAHTKTHPDFCLCAYTMKVFNFCTMMKDLGHTVIHYGNRGSNPLCDEQVDILDETRFSDFYPTDYRKELFRLDSNYRGWPVFNSLAADELRKRVKNPAREFIISFFGNCHKPIADAVPGIFVEAGIGYTGHFARWKVFESYFWLAVNCGALNPNGWADSYHVVIPNSFNSEWFTPDPAACPSYYLFIGRLVESKGLQIVKHLSPHLSHPVKVAGQGDPSILELDAYPRLQYVGTVSVESRRALYQNSIATFVPTLYLEPFGGVAVESMLCGTPAITSDWGAFTETVAHGVSGFRCRTFQDFLAAAERAPRLDRAAVCAHAQRYTLDNVKLMYQDYFEKILDVYQGKGWYEVRDDRTAMPLEWLKGF